MKKYSPEVANELDGIEFQTPIDAGKTLGALMMLTTRCLDQVMGQDYTQQTMLRVMEQMATGEPHKRTKVEMINRSKIN